MGPLLTELLGLSGVDVESYEATEDSLILDVEVHAASAVCPGCGTVSHQMHQNHWYLVRDLLISHYGKTWLRDNRRQCKCTVCGKPFSKDLEVMGARTVTPSGWFSK
jgi:transposase